MCRFLIKHKNTHNVAYTPSFAFRTPLIKNGSYILSYRCLWFFFLKNTLIHDLYHICESALWNCILKCYEIHFDLLLPRKNKIRQFIISLMAPAFYHKMQLTLLNDWHQSTCSVQFINEVSKEWRGKMQIS